MVSDWLIISGMEDVSRPLSFYLKWRSYAHFFIHIKFELPFMPYFIIAIKHIKSCNYPNNYDFYDINLD